MHTVYRDAVDAAKRHRTIEMARLVDEKRIRDADRADIKAKNDALLARLRRAGVVRKKVPKLTAKDMRYLEWLEAKLELNKDAA